MAERVKGTRPGRPANPNGRRTGRPTQRAENPQAPKKPGWKPVFLKAFAESGHLGKSCAAANISTTEVWHQRKGPLADPDFAKAYDDAKAQAVELLEAEAIRRAHDGVDEPVFYKGDECGAVRKYSDTLLQFLLRALNPAVYRDQLNLNVEKLDEKIEKELEALLATQHKTEADKNGSTENS